MCYNEFTFMAGVLVLLYLKGRGRVVRASLNSMRSSASTSAAIHYANNVMYGALALMFILNVALLMAIGENLMFMVPFAFATIALVLHRLTGLRMWLFAAIFATLLHAFSFLFALSMALTIGAYGAVMMIGAIDLMMLIPMADLYMMPSRSRRK